MRERRLHEKTEEFQEQYRLRGGIEALFGRLKQFTPLRRLGVRGKSAVFNAMHSIMAVHNIMQMTEFYKMQDANPYFREWVRFRYDTTVEFLKIPKNVLGADFPVSACCNDSSTKSKDATGINIYYFTEAIDYIELEMCGDISNTELAARVPDLFLSRAASIRKDFSCFGLGFAFYPDTAFLIWALNKLFGLGCWISAGKGRVNIATSEMNNLPNEEDIIGEAYNYERNNPELFEGSPDSSAAVFFSSNTKINYGDSKADYENTYNNLVKACFETNLPIDVILNLEETKNHSLLVLADVACLGTSEIEILKDFLKSGGTVIASGLLGLLDENSNELEHDFLQSFGLNCKLPEVSRPIDEKELFSPDLTVTRHAKNENGIIKLELAGIQRFCSVKLY